MITRPFTIITACSSIILLVQMLSPRAVAFRKIPDVDEFMVKNQRTRTHTRQNYIVQRELDDEMAGNMDNTGPAYVTEPLDRPDTSPEELPALIVDYANMIRNDIILLDNSVETRTRKRGNVRKSDDHAFIDPPCSCKSLEREEINLSEKYGTTVFPSRLVSAVCNDHLCLPPYRCKRSYYFVTVLKRRSLNEKNEPDDDMLPSELKKRWVARRENVTTGCFCTAGGLELN